MVPPSELILSSVSLFKVFHFLFPLLSHSFIFLLYLSVPWVGGHRRRCEARVRVCAGNYGNLVLNGQWPSRMIGSCCQRRLFMQTGSRVGRPQMGPSDMKRGTRGRIYSPSFQFQTHNVFLGKLKEVLDWVTELHARHISGLSVGTVCFESRQI